MKFCKNCVYFRPVYETDGTLIAINSRCAAIERFNLVSGEPDYWFATVIRESSLSTMCGSEGRLYVERPALSPSQEAQIAAQENSHE